MSRPLGADDEDYLDSEPWQKAKTSDAAGSVSSFLTNHKKAAKIGAGVSIGILFLVVVISVSTGGSCEDKEETESCKIRKGIGMCTSTSLLEMTEMEVMCRKTCGFCENIKDDVNHGDEDDEEINNTEEKGSDAMEKGASKEDYSVSDPQFQQAILEVHNDRRGMHQSTGPLKWSKAAEDIAQKWCNQLAKEGKMYHSTREFKDGMGENLYSQSWTSSGADLAKNTIERWYNREIGMWDFKTNVFIEGAGHFTQVVWKGTTEVGCAYASKRWTYVCCNYNPPGNYRGRFKENVLKFKN